MTLARLAHVVTMWLLFVGVAAASADLAGPDTGRGEFARAMDEAMARMHVDMAAAYTGDPDRDFARMMIPHHQGAIDMARIELQHGKDERLRRLAQAIIVEQQQEIAAMRSILGPEATANPSHPQPTSHHGNHR